jgi:hypothetical protein
VGSAQFVLKTLRHENRGRAILVFESDFRPEA